MKKIKGVFVRHGISEANRDGILIGWMDMPLAEEGVSELKEIRNNTTYPDTEVYLVSPLIRARQTSDILFGERDLIVKNGFKELGFGEIEGVPFASVDLNQIFDDWYEDKVEEGGETYTGFTKRVVDELYATLDECASNDIDSFTLTSHSCVMRSIKSHLLDIDKYKFLSIEMENGHGFIADIEYDELNKSIVNCELSEI